MSKLDKYNPEIAEKVRSGSYYKEAWDWYALKYIYPASQRTFFIFITIAALLVTISAIVVVYNFYPLKVRVPVVVGISDMTEDYAHLIKMPVPEEGEPSQPIVTYLVRKYVEKLETYDFKQIDRQLKFLSQFSAPGLLKEIEKRYDTRNLDSLILKYRDHTTRSIEITQVRLSVAEGFDLAKAKQNDIVQEDIPYQAIVNFESKEVNLLGITTHKWQAIVECTMSPIVFNKENQTFNALDFVVNSYRVSLVQ